MKTVNLGDPFEKRLTLRLTEAQMDFIVAISKTLGISPSEYFRMAINASMSNPDVIKYIGGTSNENVKTDSNDKL